MTVEKKAFTMRLGSTNYKKLQSIAKKNHRSMAGELELIVERYISDYELKNGSIALADNDNVLKTASIINNQVGNNNLQVTSV